MVERILHDYDRAYGLKHIILRDFNVIGADSQGRTGEWHEPETHIVPNLLRSALDASKTCIIHGDDYDTHDGTCIRDYVNMEDLAEAHRLAYEYLKRLNQSNDFNLGSQNGVSVRELFNTCAKVLGNGISVTTGPRREGDAAVLFADSGKAHCLLGWQPTRNLEHSIKTAYDWETKLNSKA